MIQGKLFGPILDLLIETMARDNLLNSACLEFFDFIKRENIKTVISHIVENYSDKLEKITYVDIFSNFCIRYYQASSVETSFLDTDVEGDAPKRQENGRGSRWDSGIKDLDATEEEYFNTSDNEEEANEKSSENKPNGASPASKPLVDYNSDEENETAESASGNAQDPNTPQSTSSKNSKDVILTPGSSSASTPPERVSEKRRREEEDDDDMSKLATNPKRRNSTSSTTSAGSNTSSVLRRKKSFTNSGSGGKGNKIAISISPAIKTGGEGAGNGENGN
jgi:protein phosphatase 4 regulatory subunit 3